MHLLHYYQAPEDTRGEDLKGIWGKRIGKVFLEMFYKCDDEWI